MCNPFSSIHRSIYLSEMTEKEVDLLVIGGGITGAGILLDAQARGISSCLIDMQDFGAGTSSRSTKLIHGGLRYLKQLEFKLVAEVGKERAIVYENAPHVTTPLKMVLPIVKGGTFGKVSTSLGLKIYDYLAGVKKHERRRMLNKAETLRKEPLLRQDIVKGGGEYVEYRTDDARLTIEIIKKAVEYGAKAVNYAKAESFIYLDNQIVGVTVVDQVSQRTYEIYAKKIVNATGPWVDTVRDKDNSKYGKYLQLTKGVHIVVDQGRFPLKHAVYFDAPDKRMVFAIPRSGRTYIGTTDTHYTDDPLRPRMTTADLDYLIQSINTMFPTVNLTTDDVESSWSGLRPLIYEEGKRTTEISRKDEIFVSNSGLLSIAGGKLTGYRKMAERIVDIVADDLGVQSRCSTDKIRLSGGDFGGSVRFESFVRKQIAVGVGLGLDSGVSEELARRYGTNVQRVFETMKTSKSEAKQYQMTPEIFAALRYGIEDEMATTAVDFFIRRTGAMFFNIDWVKEWKEPVLNYMKKRLYWTEKEVRKQRKDLDVELVHAVVPSDQTDPHK